MERIPSLHQFEQMNGCIRTIEQRRSLDKANGQVCQHIKGCPLRGAQQKDAVNTHPEVSTKDAGEAEDRTWLTGLSVFSMILMISFSLGVAIGFFVGNWGFK